MAWKEDPLTFQQAYVQLFDAFTRERGIDDDDTYWSEADKLAFRAAYQNLLLAYNRTI
jgi:hypothetical protein